MKPNYRLKDDWGMLKAGSIFKWKTKGYVYEFENGGYIGLPESFVVESESLFEMVNPMKSFLFMGYNENQLMKMIDCWKEHHFDDPS